MLTRFTDGTDTGGIASMLNKRVRIKEILINWQVFHYSLLYDKSPQNLVSLNYGNTSFTHESVLGQGWQGQESVPLSVRLKGEELKSDAPVRCWWWASAPPGPPSGLGRHTNLLLISCAAAWLPHEVVGWVPMASIQKKTGREVQKWYYLYGQASKAIVLLLLCLLI